MCRSITTAAQSSGWLCDALALADGGEGTLDALGGVNRTTTVRGPLGRTISAGWRLTGGTAVIEMAKASGISLVGGAAGNRPIDASTVGTGELITAALAGGAKRIIVCLGGSATTDGGQGALDAVSAAGALNRLRHVELLVACDVQTRFVDAASVFGPQKGASPTHVAFLTRRLERQVQLYSERYGVDVGDVPGGGAAGGLAGALLAVGGVLVPGFDLVADELHLADRISGADLVITGEGHLDPQSFAGKVVGGVAAMAHHAGVPCVAIVGGADPGLRRHPGFPAGFDYVSLVERFGEDQAMWATPACIEDAAVELFVDR